MKINKNILYKITTILFLILVGIIMLIIGRGHTIYFDNKTIENSPYFALNRIDVSVKNNEEQSLFPRERAMVTVTGQRVVVKLSYMKEHGGTKEQAIFSLRIPYSLDGVVINLPALIAGADSSSYMSAFIPVSNEAESVAETVVTDEFTIDNF